MADFIHRVFVALTETHPIHAMFVHFPIGLAAGSFLFILIALWKKDERFEFAAFASFALMNLSSWLAGATGIYDNNISYKGKADFHDLKIILAIALLIVSSGALYYRFRVPRLLTSRFKILYALAIGISFVITLLLGFLGGAILYGF